MKKFRLAVAIIFVLPVFIPTVLLALLSGFFFLLRLRRLGNLWLHFWLDITIWWIWICFGAKMIVTGRENLPAKGTRVCYIGNHQSMMDVPALFWAGMWSGIIGKVELKKIPVLNWLMMELNCVYIDRKNLRASLKAISTGAENIKKGIPMSIFPEGTRSKTREIAEFKAGSFKMATKAKAVIIPVVFQNTRLLFEDAGSFRRVPVYVKILPGIDTSVMDDEEIKNVHCIVEEKVKEAYASLPCVKR